MCAIWAVVLGSSFHPLDAYFWWSDIHSPPLSGTNVEAEKGVLCVPAVGGGVGKWKVSDETNDMKIFTHHQNSIPNASHSLCSSLFLCFSLSLHLLH
uniref:Putative secreted protein n=1 Tax=Anopheles darlingi TaxID=43151 RepID=A0A2M4DC67_ANODA